MHINATVCELGDNPAAFAHDWEQLVAHVKAAQSGLVVLPEMPFYPWFAATRPFDPSIWQAAVEAHNRWEARLHDLAPAVVIGSRPINAGQRRLNQGFVWDTQAGYRGVHAKYYLPDEEGFWEASWYERGSADFTPAQCGPIQVGLLICTDVMCVSDTAIIQRHPSQQ